MAEQRVNERDLALSERAAARRAARRARDGERPATETVPGGRYQVGGQMVDSEGRPLKAPKGDGE